MWTVKITFSTINSIRKINLFFFDFNTGCDYIKIIICINYISTNLGLSEFVPRAARRCGHGATTWSSLETLAFPAGRSQYGSGPKRSTRKSMNTRTLLGRCRVGR